jgi:hypothetical protein
MLQRSIGISAKAARSSEGAPQCPGAIHWQNLLTFFPKPCFTDNDTAEEIRLDMLWRLWPRLD